MVFKKELQDMANVLRRDVLKMTTSAGSGHPTSCMSCAEIMSYLFFKEMKYDIKDPFNPDNDEFVLSKGHAAPILYSCLHHSGCIKDNLLSLRKINSRLEGHPMPSSLKWVKVATGSLGQGLSIGIGMALASKFQKRKFKTYVLLGDSEMAEGSVYEALQLASFYKLDNLVAIIDVNRLGQRGETMVGHKTSIYKNRFKSFGWDSAIIDGHSIKDISKTFKLAKNSKKPFAIIAKTLKGKGVSFLENKNGWHGKPLNKEQLIKALKEIPSVNPLKIKIKKPKSVNFKFSKKNNKSSIKYSKNEKIATRDAYGGALANLSYLNSKVLAVDAEVSNSTKSEKVKNKTPKQFIEAYIAEQNMIGMALGLSVKGFNVFASTFAAFLTRAHDQIRMSAISKANLNICGSHSGISIGEDGASQMGIEDIALFRSLPNSIIFYPSDAVSTLKLVNLANSLKGIKYIRTTREKTPVIYDNKEKFLLGDFKVLKQSKKDKVVLIGAGITLHEALKAYSELKKYNINVSVIDLYCIKPLDSKKLLKFVKKHGNKMIVIEDHRPEGGIGEMISYEFRNTNTQIESLAVKEIPHSGKKDELLKKYGINYESIVKIVKK